MGLVSHHLQIGERRAVIDLDEGYGLGDAPGLDPTLHQELASSGVLLNDFSYWCAVHRSILAPSANIRKSRVRHPPVGAFLVGAFTHNRRV